MLKKILLFIFLFIIFKLSANEKIVNFDYETIKIIQKSRYKYEFIKNNRYLMDAESIIKALNDIPDARISYIKAHNGYIGATTAYAFGISLTCTCVLMESISIPVTLVNGYNKFPLGVTIGFGSGLIVSIALLISGIIYRNEYKLKEIEAIRYYNQKKLLLFSCMPVLDFDEKMNADFGFLMTFKFN